MSLERKIIVGLIFLMFLLGLVFIQKSFGFPNEPTGYFNYKWGTPVKKFDCVLVKVLSIEEVNIDLYAPEQQEGVATTLVFLDGKLAALVFRLLGDVDIKEFANSLFMAFGKPTEVSTTSIMWKSETAVATLNVATNTVIAGSTTGLDSMEALLRWYTSKGREIDPEGMLGL